jgi:hypothetical protein
MRRFTIRLPVLFAGIFLSAFLICSCATTGQRFVTVPAAQLPPDTAINKEAGHGDWLYVTLHLENGQRLRFLVDTGSPYTILEKSLEPKLGRPFGNVKIPAPWYGIDMKLRTYRSPALYLGNTRLVLGNRVLAGDFQIWSGPHVSGILGMNCLRHYCVQLDFANEEIRFLNPKNLKTEELGEAFPLTFSNGGDPDIPGVDGGARTHPNIHGALAGGTNLDSEIDTGVPGDGALEIKLFEHELKKQKGASAEEYKMTTGQIVTYARFPDVLFAGEVYTNLVLDESPAGNVVGLRFLARNLVTLDFPQGIMCLKQTSIGPPVD